MTTNQGILADRASRLTWPRSLLAQIDRQSLQLEARGQPGQGETSQLSFHIRYSAHRPGSIALRHNLA